jgi:hypothetical protein
LSPGTRKTLAAIGALWISFAATASANAGSANPVTCESASSSGTATLPRSLEERAGDYIVGIVGRCDDCRSRHEKGEFDHSRWHVGASLPFQPTVPMPWSPAAPPIAGLPSMTEVQGVVFLTTGKRPDGSSPRPPMPEFRLNTADASAVVAYLKSLSK